MGFDVDSEKVAVAVAELGGEVRSLGTIPNREESVRRLAKKLGPASRLRVCYEAGPHGYGLYWLLSGLGVHCDVVAPTLVPVKAGDRVKTNRRDAMKLARIYRSGYLTAVWVPDAEHEALRDLVRAREVAKKDQLRARHRLGKFLLRRGLRALAGMKNWTAKHLVWVKTTMLESYTPFPHTNAFVFMMGLEAVLAGLFVASNDLVKERSIYLRERMVNLKVLPYLVNKVLIYSASVIIQVVLLISSSFRSAWITPKEVCISTGPLNSSSRSTSR